MDSTAPTQVVSGNPIILGSESVRNEILEAPDSHDLTSAQVAAITALGDEEIDAALSASADDEFWDAYDSVRRQAIARLAEQVGTQAWTVFGYVDGADEADEAVALTVVPGEHELLAGQSDNDPWAIVVHAATPEQAQDEAVEAHG